MRGKQPWRSGRVAIAGVGLGVGLTLAWVTWPAVDRREQAVQLIAKNFRGAPAPRSQTVTRSDFTWRGAFGAGRGTDIFGNTSTVHWTSLGPRRIPQGNSLFGSGKFQTVAVVHENPDVMYAGCGLGPGYQGPLAQCGVFKTTDGGRNWAPVNRGLTDNMVNVLWLEQTNPNVLLAGTEKVGIFRSADGGGSWVLVAPVGATSEFAVTEMGVILAATATGILQSSDGGRTWSVLVAPDPLDPVRALDASGGAIVAGLHNGRLLMQPAPGAPWRTSVPPGWSPGRTIGSVAIEPRTPSTAYALVEMGWPTVLVKTTDGGGSWTALDQPTVPDGRQSSGQGLAFDPSGTLWVAGWASLFSSRDGGQSWVFHNSHGFDIRRTIHPPGQSALIAATDQGLFRTLDAGDSWTGLTDSTSNSLLYTMAIRGSTILTAPQDYSPMLSLDGGASWKHEWWTDSPPPVGESGDVLINPADPEYCYAYTFIGYQYSEDGCRTFAMSPTPRPGTTTYVQPGGTDIIAVDPVTPSTVYLAAASGVFKSTDWGATMEPTGWGLAQATAIAVDGATIYVGTTDGLHQSVDGGTSWRRLGLGPVAGYPSTIAMHPTNSQVVLIGMSAGPGKGGGVLKTIDGGATLRVVNEGLSTIPVFHICCGGVDLLSLEFGSGSAVALASNDAIYVSTDAGDHWQDVTGDALVSYFSDVAWEGDYLYATTLGQGVLRASVSEVTAAPPTPSPAAPGAPANLQVSVNAFSVTFTWDMAVVASDPATRDPATAYTLKAGLATGSYPFLFPLGNTTTFTATGPAGTYFAVVSGSNAQGEGPPSNEVSFSLPGGGSPPGCTSAPDPPTSLSGAVTVGAVALNWNPSTGCPATSYVLEAGSTSGQSDLANFDTRTPAASFTQPVVPDGTYFVRVRGRNAHGTSDPSTEIRVVVGGT